MACRTITDEKLGKIWICGEGLRDTMVCRVCGDIATILCDYPIGNDKTCDSALCEHHSVSIRGDLDYCHEHSSEYGKIVTLTRLENNGSGI